jgi:hypothetical protein
MAKECVAITDQATMKEMQRSSTSPRTMVIDSVDLVI